MNILITGGTGFIGSHTYIAIRKNYPHAQIVIADNFSNSTTQTLQNLRKIVAKNIHFYEVELCDRNALEQLFRKYDFHSVIHFAGLKAVGESVVNPLKYYENNIVSTLNLVKLCLAYKVTKFVFSSSATVYGDGESPLAETHPVLQANNPYGETKLMCERILKAVAYANPTFCVSLLRYFNPVGAHESGIIGEAPNGIPTNLMPFITKVAKGELRKLQVFGGDYPTVDGTAVRDFIHVMDLAEGHVAALQHLSPGVQIYNLGTGRGTSVLELLHTFEKVNEIAIPYEIVARRPGDLAVVYANVSKAEQALQWKAQRSVEQMCQDAWRFEKQLAIV